jgi:hypothetical protein
MHATDHLQRKLRERNWRRNKREREERSSIHGRGGCNNPVRRRTWHPQDPNSMSNLMIVESPSSSMDDGNNNKDAHKTTLIRMDNRSTPSTNWTLGSSSPPPVYFAPPLNRRLLLPPQMSSLMVRTQMDVILSTDWLGCKNRALSASVFACVCVCVCVCVLVRVCLCLSVEENWRCALERWWYLIPRSFFKARWTGRQNSGIFTHDAEQQTYKESRW